ncbi:MAG: prepilin-type N-terminal cleavage/methylation domain-containing protein [Lachnospiraceae bacterium]|nr:prepilin-type N-terminal cleavage/methylation domain-containing protein [Lachnospiraceae bacterium]
MRKVACVKRKFNNAGMTLVELIVAIAIITVAIIPLMFGFIFVLKNNLRAREVQQATVLAHSVMENCKAFPVDLPDTATVDDVYKKLQAGTFMQGVTAAQTLIRGDNFLIDGATVGESEYDVFVTITNRESAALLEYAEMNEYNDAVFQSQYATSTDATPVFASEVDNRAYIKMLEDLKQKAYEEAADLPAGEQKDSFNVSLSTLDESFKTSGINRTVNYNLKREIIITADSSGGVDTATVTFKYSYDLDADFKVKWLKSDNINYWNMTVPECSSDDLVTYTFQIYDNTDTQGEGTQLDNLYFFYYPSYKSNDELTLEFQIVEDKITINNNLGRGMDVYLFKQLNPTIGEHNTTILEATYQPQIYGNGGAINLYHNLFENIGASGSGNSWSESFLYGTNISTLGTAETLIKTGTKELLHDIEVGVFPAGTYDEDSHAWDTSAEAIITLDGTVLNQ